MNKQILFLLFSATLVFPNFYGPADYILEKRWEIGGTPGTEYILNGIFVINDSGQEVTNVETSPGMRLDYLEGGVIKVNYEGRLNSTNQTVFARARIDINRGNPLLDDSGFEIAGVETTNLTEYNQEIKETAIRLANTNSSLETIKNIAEWVNGFLTYDKSYFGKSDSAQTVYSNRRGVCVEYTHLTISMLNSLGFRTRYVAGHTKGEEFQPHSWAQVWTENNGWIDVDATFMEIGQMDNTHIKTFYGKDQADIVDEVGTYGDLDFYSTETIEEIASRKDDGRLVDAELSFNESNYTIGLQLQNREDRYVFIDYGFYLPANFGGADERILLFGPEEKKTISYNLNESLFNEGYTYSIPIKARLNDFEIDDVVTVKKSSRAVDENKEDGIVVAPFCGSALSMLLFTVLASRLYLRRKFLV